MAKRAGPKERLTVKRDPGEARASPQSTRDLVDPSVIKLHPAWLVAAKVAGLNILPEVVGFEVFARSNGVDRPLALECETQKLDGADEDRSGGRGTVVLVAACPEHDRAQAEHDCGEQPSAPETNVLFHVDHGNLTGESTGVDELSNC